MTIRRCRRPLVAAVLLGGICLADAPARAQESSTPAATEAAVAPAAAATQQRSRRRSSRSRRARPAPPLRYSSPESAGALVTDIEGLLSARIRSGRWGVMVVSLTRGDTLFARNAGEPLAPASTMKLFTAALVLDRFGPDYQFSTAVLRDGTVTPDGTLEGNIILRGDGDPAFSNRFLHGDRAAPLSLLAEYVAKAGITRITGDVIGDPSAFEERRIPEGWRSRYLGFSYAAPVSALSLNENVVWVVVHPGKAGEPGTIALEPASSSIAIRNAVRTVAGRRRGNIVVRRAGDNGIEVRGWIGSGAPPRRYELVVNDPATFTTGAFRDALVAQGITVDGQARLSVAPPEAVEVTALPSPPLSRLLSVMNRESVNHYAELLYRNAARGVDRTEYGTAENAYAHLREFMTDKVGGDPNAVYATDGSGLSALDRITPRAMVRLLAYSHEAPWSSTFHASLPVAGESELLRNRMRYTPAQGNLHAKTGTTNDVISLAGYTTARNGEVIAFAFMYNGYDRGNAKATIDAMGATLAGFIRP